MSVIPNIVLLLAQSIAAASSPRIETTVGPVTVEVDLPSKAVGLSDAFVIDAVLTAPDHVTLDWPKLETLPADLAEGDAERQGPDRFDGRFGKRVLLRWQVRVEPMHLGKVPLGRLRVRYRDASDTEWTTESVELPVIDVVAQSTRSEDPSTLRPIPSLDRRGSFWSLPNLLQWGGALFFLLVAGAWGIYALRYRRDADPRLRALDELKAIESQLQSSGTDSRRTLDRVCDLLRHYLEARYELAAPRQSTPEFLASARTREHLGPGQRSALEEFLRAADAARFAHDEPDQETATEGLLRARVFLLGEA
ncbi:hypothetical protein Pan216_24590 [Planctomycetes bacterium Pan216]|uniref:Protein BatD n=1 Tax=Kolteria novifilia TaxID=2527975 RepID=A0A518B3M4_9BACT|nr:hypothetical protein Pan216_24590 [Planctomycetes bacterium Pan216]